MAGADRSRSRRSQRRVVQYAHLDRRGLQRYQTRRMAVAPNQDDGCSAGQSLMVSHCRGHFMGAQCGWRGRCDAAMQWIGSVTRIAYRSSHGDQALATTAAELLCPRTATHFRGRARRTTIADGTLLSGALAHHSAAAQKIQEGEKAPFSYLVIG